MQPLFREYLDVEGDFLNYDDFNKNFRLKKVSSFNFAYDVVDRYGTEDPERPALLWTDPSGREERFDFRRMMLESNKAANYFKSLGIRKGDPVLVILKRHWEFWPVIIGLHKLGAVTIPATHLLTAKDIRYRVQAAGVKAVICTEQGSCVADSVAEAAPDCPTLEHRILARSRREGFLNFDDGFAAASDVWEKPQGDDYPCNEDIMLVYFTSGTTGNPKMVAHNFFYPLGHIITSVYWQQVEDGGLHLTVSETGWGKAVWGKLYGQWLGGCCVFVYDFDKFKGTEILGMIEKYRITTYCCPPTMYRMILQEDFSRFDLSSLRHCSVAGEPLSPEIANDWKERTGIELHEAFGQTELVATLATFPWMKVCPGSMGKPAPLFDIDIVDPEGNSCPAGVTGEIAIRIHHGKPFGMFAGYYNNPEMTAEAFENGLYRTRDLAWKDEWGYYWYVGRADDVIKSSGYRIGPFEVESALLEHPAVLECAITGAPDPIRGQIVKATVVLKPGYTPSDALVRELQDHVKHLTAPYKYPRKVEFIDELPKTISGKVRRFELRKKEEET